MAKLITPKKIELKEKKKDSLLKIDEDKKNEIQNMIAKHKNSAAKIIKTWLSSSKKK